ncbi:MAG: hypothetical protein EA403_05920 [Spirochaetaceae bacterium]|nr:MAG: hypothetical protein EA403_05920 [Spirochaetaceae bacterium]
MVSTLILCAVVGFLPAAPLAAQSVETWLAGLSASDRTVLARGERVTSFFSDHTELSLLPPSAFSDTVVERYRALSPRLGVEALYLLPIPAEVRSRPDFQVRLYNILRSVSTMAGIEYFSASRNQMREFFLESYTIDNPQNRRRVPDALVAEIPPVATLYAFQRDSTFGRNIYALTYRVENGLTWLSMINRSRMTYGIVPLVGEQNLEIHLLVIPVEEGLLFSGSCGLRILGMFGMMDRAQASFQNRIDAIYGWFTARVREEFALQ